MTTGTARRRSPSPRQRPGAQDDRAIALRRELTPFGCTSGCCPLLNSSPVCLRGTNPALWKHGTQSVYGLRLLSPGWGTCLRVLPGERDQSPASFIHGHQSPVCVTHRNTDGLWPAAGYPRSGPGTPVCPLLRPVGPRPTPHSAIPTLTKFQSFRRMLTLPN
jgi:hypothetical protein